MQLPNRNKLILASIVLVPVVISLIVFVFVNTRGSNSEEYFDPGSGETVSSPKNKTPELFGVDSEGPLFLGFSKLVGAGLTAGQLDLVRSIFGRFSTTNERNIKELSVTVDTIEQTIDDSGISLTFDLTANRTTKYLCVISYSGLDYARVVVSDKAGKQIFDSSIE